MVLCSSVEPWHLASTSHCTFRLWAETTTVRQVVHDNGLALGEMLVRISSTSVELTNNREFVVSKHSRGGRIASKACNETSSLWRTTIQYRRKNEGGNPWIQAIPLGASCAIRGHVAGAPRLLNEARTRQRTPDPEWHRKPSYHGPHGQRPKECSVCSPYSKSRIS
jgi:hypothetical protein